MERTAGKGLQAGSTGSASAVVPKQGTKGKGTASKAVSRGGATKGRPVIQYQGKEVVQGPGMWKEIRTLAKAKASAKATQPTLVRGGMTQGVLQALWALVRMLRSVENRTKTSGPSTKRQKTTGSSSSKDLALTGTSMPGLDGEDMTDDSHVPGFQTYEFENPEWLGKTLNGRQITVQELTVSFCELTIPEFAVYQRIQRANGTEVPKCSAAARMEYAHGQHRAQVQSHAKREELLTSAQKCWAAVQSITGEQNPLIDMVALFKSAGISVDSTRLYTDLRQSPGAYWKYVLPTAERKGHVLDLEVLSKHLTGARNAPSRTGPTV